MRILESFENVFFRMDIMRSIYSRDWSGSYDRIVIEASGVAEPKNIREEFIEAADSHQVGSGK